MFYLMFMTLICSILSSSAFPISDLHSVSYWSSYILCILDLKCLICLCQIHFSGLLDMLLLLLDLACWFDWFLRTSAFCVFHFRFYAINSLDLDAVWFQDMMEICRSSLYCCLLNSDPINMLHNVVQFIIFVPWMCNLSFYLSRV